MGFYHLIDTKINDYSFSAGVRGKLGTWDYDLSNTSGENTIAFNINNTVNASLPTGTSPTSNYSGGLDNTSNGRFLYPRAVSQFGFSGRYVYGKIACTF